MKKPKLTPFEIAVLVVGLALGYLIWLLSPAFTGQKEPWDAAGLYYPGCMFLAGAVLGLIAPRHFWVWPIAITLGQFPFVGFGIFSPFGPVTGLFLILGGFPSWFGSGAGAVIRIVLKNVIQKRKNQNDSQQPAGG